MTATAWPVGGLADGFPAAPQLCSVDGWLFGGWGLGLLVEAARADGGAVLDLATAFLRPVRVGSRITVGCEVTVAGRTVRHCRVEAHADGQPALRATAVVAANRAAAAGAIAAGPAPADVPPPERCRERDYAGGLGVGVASLLDVRLAGEHVDAGAAGRVLLWVRTRVPAPGDVRLAVASDHVPYLLRRVDPTIARISTVSASLRVLDGDVDEWILADVAVVAIGDRVAVGRVALWSGGTRLAAVAEQTALLKRR